MLQVKREKWVILIHGVYTRDTYVEADSISEVQAFFRNEHTRESFDTKNYSIYPPLTDLTVRELFPYDITVNKPVYIRDDD